MPQADSRQREKWGGQEGVGEEKAMFFLTQRGYVLRRGFSWKKPAPNHVPTNDEYEAIEFLIDEWDFGGLE